MSFIRKIPGFRSGKVWKMCLASFVYLIIFLGVVGAIISPSSSDAQISNTQKEGILIAKSVYDMLPAKSEMPTEFLMDEAKTIQANASGLKSAASISGTKIGRITGTTVEAIIVSFDVYDFSSIDNAKSFYNKKVAGIKNGSGYTAINNPLSVDCFTYKQDYGFDSKFGIGICNKQNIVFTTEVTTANSFQNSESYLNDMMRTINSKIQ